MLAQSLGIAGERMTTARLGWQVWLCLIALWAMQQAIAADRRPRLPKGVEAVRLEDGRYAVTVKTSTALPSGDQVVRADPRARLERAAVLLCPSGHDLETDGAVRIGIDPAGRFTSTLRGFVRCLPADKTEPQPQQASTEREPR
jgi:hypothetical protein